MIGGFQAGVMGGRDFSPASLFAAGEQGVWYDPSDFSTIFQDAAGTTPVTAVDQPVGKILDKSGRGNHATQATNDYRPVLKQDANGCYYLLFDGSNDYLVTGNIDFSAVNKVTIFCGVKKVSDQAFDVIAELSINTNLNTGFFLGSSGMTSGGNPQAPNRNSFACGTRGAISIAYISGHTYVAPMVAVISATLDNAASGAQNQCVLRVNGADPSAVYDDGAETTNANYENIPLYLGSRGGLSNYFEGNIYSFIARGTLSTQTQIEQGEAWVNRKTRAY